mmetsp:Transcript_34611/g.74823  ORF Transcript_34611/g.74823 Transcript_34611/m.74823 type:complete len:281 (+) Transcript_34611:290-1132(+)
MIAEVNILHSYSNGKLNELGLDAYCDFGFPICHATAAYQSEQLAEATATLHRVSSSKLELRSPSKLDQVTRSFAAVLLDDGKEIDTRLLIKACRALLDLIRSTGAASLRLAAKDFESNLRKVERLFEESPVECRTLASLLELERERDIHDGNVLRDPSAAIGLLWIRRSLAFQSHLYYESLVRSDHGKHPKEVAREAYDEHLSPYHGWMLRTVFPASLSQMPGQAVFLSKFGEVEIEDLDREDEARVVKELRLFSETLEPLLEVWKENFVKLNLEDTRRV